MTKIELRHISKKFNRQWVFKDVSHLFKPAAKTAIIGTNGSGKSTLLKIISAAELPSEGKVIYHGNEGTIDLNEAYKTISFAAPYMDLPEQLTPEELFQFQLKFKAFQEKLSFDAFLEAIQLSNARNKLISNFSSGMKQRLKLGLAICCESDVLLLDEPCSNLDKQGIKTYHQLMNRFSKDKTVIISSNEQAEEMMDPQEIIPITDFKQTES
jgi:ABC-type multidrug transport system ATPase subunit